MIPVRHLCLWIKSWCWTRWLWQKLLLSGVGRFPVRQYGSWERRRELGGGRGWNGCLPPQQEPESETTAAQHLPDVRKLLRFLQDEPMTRSELSKIKVLTGIKNTKTEEWKEASGVIHLGTRVLKSVKVLISLQCCYFWHSWNIKWNNSDIFPYFSAHIK